ncbi:MAG: sensor domain-containing protein [Propionibacteriaceae bacterium]|nr:sensor domain-containing protein [Propionibacteriaceae bacterium]
MTDTRPRATRRGLFRDVDEPGRARPLAVFGRALGYSVLSGILGLIVFLLEVALIPTGIALAIVYIGLGVIGGAFALARLNAAIHRSLLGRGRLVQWPPAPRHRPGLLGWLRSLLTSQQRWRELGFALVGGLVAFALLVIVLFVLLFAIAELAAPMRDVNGLVESGVSDGVRVSWGLAPAVDAAASPWWDVVIGVVVLVLWVLLVVLVAQAEIGLARLFLSPSARTIEAQVARLSEEKASAAAAESRTLGQIERDLHDGPQQNLIRAGMDLAAAERRLAAGDTEAVAGLLADLRRRNDETLASLRSLSRGIAPPVLAEQGVGAAIRSLAAASPLNVSVDDTLPASARYPRAVERTVYFVTAEALANAAKHSGASSVTVRTGENDGRVWAEIADDGIGEAQEQAGGGLEGLRQRVASVGGEFTIDAANGRGTTIRADIPIGER